MQSGGHITLFGTATGIILTTCLPTGRLAVNISTNQVANTIVLATIGATVSFTVSLTLKWLIGKVRRKK